MHGRPLIDAILITMLSALLFSLPPLDNDLKSFVKNVPIPKAATNTLNQNHMAKEIMEENERNPTIETKLIALLFQHDCFFDVERIRVHDQFLAGIDA
jgi:hypothetical protein